ncbi:MAG TPA: response regulator transcription factor [Burkholderiales bacterium]|nr:response regulator transcription factor [Burkholderiales bacterium]
MPELNVRLLLVDDHEVVRAGLRALLAGIDGIEVVGEAGSVAEAVREAARLAPQVILMDLRLPDGSGLDACREILSESPQTRILFLTSYSDAEAVMSTVLAGAAGYVLKDIGHRALVDAIRATAAGRSILDPRITEPVVSRVRRAEALSGQEQRVVALVVEGRTNKEIAVALGLSDKTVKNYLSNAFQKLGISRRAQAAALFGTGTILPE